MRLAEAPIFPWRRGGSPTSNPAGAPSALGPGGIALAPSLLPPSQQTALALPQDVARQRSLLNVIGTTGSGTGGSSSGLGGDTMGGLGGGFDVGSRLASEFMLLERLGQGGGGAVYRAKHLLDGSEYAIKRVTFWSRPGAPAHSELSAQRVLREVQALAMLNHPNVCRYHSAWVETDWPAFFNAAAQQQKAPQQPRMKLITAALDAASAGAEECLDDESSSRFHDSPTRWSTTSGGLVFEEEEGSSLSSPSSSDKGSPAHPRAASYGSSCTTPDGRQCGTGSGGISLINASRPQLSSSAAKASSPSSAATSPEGGGGSGGAGGGGSRLFARAPRLSGTKADLSVDISDSGDGGWSAAASVVDGASQMSSSSALDMFSGAQLSASKLGGGASALLGGVGGGDRGGRSGRAAGGGAAVPWSSEDGCCSEDLSCASSTTSGHGSGHGGQSALASPRGAQPPSLLHQWSYRKSLLIQMELCETSTLRDYLERRDRQLGRPDVPRSMECLVQICQGLEHVHETGIVHRDLKPANCCFASSGMLKLMDFGLSRQRASNAKSASGRRGGGMGGGGAAAAARQARPRPWWTPPKYRSIRMAPARRRTRRQSRWVAGPW